MNMISKKFKVLVGLFLCLVLFSNTAFAKESGFILNNVTTIDNILVDNNLEVMIKNNILALTNTKVTVDKLIQLHDIMGEPNYVMALFTNGGYAIVTRENALISECSINSKGNYPFKNYLNNELIYAGPGNYIVENNNVHTNNSKLIVTDELVRKNNNILNKAKLNTNKLMSPNSNIGLSSSWKGIDSSRFSRYANWINTDSTCGSHACAVMLAYLDDYVDDSFVPQSVRARKSTSPGKLITDLKQFINDDGGTWPSDLFYGIEKFMKNYNLSHRPNASEFFVDTWGRDQIDKGWPIVLGLLSLLGSPYGNHWVTAYAYNGEYYKVHDNWGSYDAIIIDDWTTGLVWMLN